jgi:hypothetical protein
MSEFNKEQSLARYTGLMQLIHVGAYQERNHEGNYGEDGIENAADELEFQAAQNGLQFFWHKDEGYYTLEPMTQEERTAFAEAIKEQEPVDYPDTPPNDIARKYKD